MKLAMLPLFFFLISFTETGVVLDTDGNPVFHSIDQYYILPVIRRKAGGLELANINDEDCPRSIVQAQNEHSNGLPVRFSSPLRILSIHPSMNLNIEFTEAPSCAPKPAKWTILDAYSSEEKSPTVVISNEQRKIGPFLIRKFENYYKIVHCTGLVFREDICTDLGIEIDDENNRRLVLKKGDPLKVQFIKVDFERSEESSTA